MSEIEMENNLRGLDKDSLQMVLDTVGQVRKRLLPKETILDFDKNNTFPEEIIRTMLGPEIGLHLLFIPEEYGGMGGGARDSCALVRAISEICLGVSTAFFAIQLGADPLLVGGTEEQKQKWLGAISAGDSLVAYAVTEAEAGSNLAALKTKADPVMDADGRITGYKINGSKQFISTWNTTSTSLVGPPHSSLSHQASKLPSVASCSMSAVIVCRRVPLLIS